jgi:hypothetical protein
MTEKRHSVGKKGIFDPLMVPFATSLILTFGFLRKKGFTGSMENPVALRVNSKGGNKKNCPALPNRDRTAKIPIPKTPDNCRVAIEVLL